MITSDSSRPLERPRWADILLCCMALLLFVCSPALANGADPSRKNTISVEVRETVTGGFEVVTSSYDEAGRPSETTTTTIGADSRKAGSEHTKMSYDSQGNRTSESTTFKNAKGETTSTVTTTTEYDEEGNPTRENWGQKDAEGRTTLTSETITTYDSGGRKTKTTATRKNANEEVTSTFTLQIEYNNQGKPTKETWTNRDGTETVVNSTEIMREYDANGRVTKATVTLKGSDGTPWRGYETTTKYDAQGRITKETVTEKTGAGQTIKTVETTTEYDAGGRVTKETTIERDGTGKTTSSTERTAEYGSQGRVTKVTWIFKDAKGNVTGKKTRERQYYGNGKLKTMTVREFNADNEELRSRWVELEYDNNGRVSRIKAHHSETNIIGYIYRAGLAPQMVTTTRLNPDEERVMVMRESYLADGWLKEIATEIRNSDGIWEKDVVCYIPPCGGDPPIFGDIMVFPTPERFLDTDLNGDGDRYDTVLRYKNLQTGVVFNTGLECSGAPHGLDIWEETIVFSAGPEWAIRCYDITTGLVRDTGGFGRNPSIHGEWIAFAGLDGTIQLFHMQEEVAIETGLPGSFPVVFDGVVAFHAGAPSTIWYYDTGTGSAVDTGAVGRTPAIHRNVIVFSTQESSAQVDLSGDGDLYDSVIRYYDLATHTVTNTGATGSWPAVFDDIIVFSTNEGSVAADLNGDGKISAPVIQYLHLLSGELINTGQLGAVPDIYNGTISFHAWESWSGLDWSGDGDTYDSVVLTCAVHLDNWALPGEHAEDREYSQEPAPL